MSVPIGECDFCYGPFFSLADGWTVEATPANIPIPLTMDGIRSKAYTYHDDGHWGACDDCMAIIRSGTVGQLVARSIWAETRSGHRPGPEAQEWKSQLIARMWQHRTGVVFRGHPDYQPVDGSTQQ